MGKLLNPDLQLPVGIFVASHFFEDTSIENNLSYFCPISH
ncbi:hypothetical protein DYBT9275_03460 [Dyadobacter sp. CECT 9275]|uniref:Uncharacterized protein n=1 Tax=Dyadobacter helix TaxID=2822344 RepID=A0A916NCY4_9BACT|nr:hypothetical protein DYBT9275_03460 [Dyadobacter sp. CECT 9275]